MVRASSQVLKEVLIPQIEQMFDLKLGQIKTELTQELISTVATKVNEVKDDLMSVVEEKLTGKVEAMKAPLKTELVNTMEAMKAPLKAELQANFNQEIVSTSTSIIQNIIVPDLDQKLSTKVDKDDLKPVVEEMKAPLKTELKSELKTDMDQQITERLEAHTPNLETIVTASSAIVNNILKPDMEQKVSIKVNEIRGIVKSELKSEMDQDLASGMTDLSQEINDKVTQQITTRITEAQEKIIFAVVRKSNVDPGNDITFDTVIANIGNSMDASTGIFTTKRKGLYMFSFAAPILFNSSEKYAQIHVMKNDIQVFQYEDENRKGNGIDASIAFSWMFQLNEGDRINLKLVGTQQLHGCSVEWTQFTGQLIHGN